MRLTTGEIKILIKRGVEQGESKTIPEIDAYIRQHTDKQFTRGQLTGAIAQLVDRNEIVRIERGVYQRRDAADEQDGANVYHEVDLKIQIVACLKKTAAELARIVSSVDILAADEEDFELLNRIRALRGDMESIINQG